VKVVLGADKNRVDADRQPQHHYNFANSGWEDRVGDALRGLRLQHKE
jgi:hypothetical protein